MAQTVKHLPTKWETRVQSLDWEDPLEKEMATHSSSLVWRIPWTEEPGRLQSMGSQRVGNVWATLLTSSTHPPPRHSPHESAHALDSGSLCFSMPTSFIASGDVNNCVDDPHNVLGSQILTSNNFSFSLFLVTSTTVWMTYTMCWALSSLRSSHPIAFPPFCLRSPSNYSTYYELFQLFIVLKSWF